MDLGIPDVFLQSKICITKQLVTSLLGGPGWPVDPTRFFFTSFLGFHHDTLTTAVPPSCSFLLTDTGTKEPQERSRPRSPDLSLRWRCRVCSITGYM